MITQTQDRWKFIGGSEAHYIYMGYHTSTFKSWWRNKLEGIVDETNANPSMVVGTMLEESVIDLYEELNGVEGQRGESATKGIARANTDYIQGDKVSDVKVTSKAFEWFLKGRVPIQYKRQLIHYRYVCELSESSIIAYQTTDSLMQDPFQPLNPHLLYEIPVQITGGEIEEHRERVEYLEWCRDNNLYPGED